MATYRRNDGGCTSQVLGVIDGMGLWIEARWHEHGVAKSNRTVVPLDYFERRYGVPAHQIAVG